MAVSSPFKKITTENPSYTKFSSAASSGSLSQPISRITGSWQGVVSCRGTNLSFDLDIKNQGENNLIATFVARKTTIQGGTRATEVSSNMAGTYNAKLAVFDLKSVSGNPESQLSLNGFIDPVSGMLSAVTTSNYYSNSCSHAIAGQKNMGDIIGAILNSGDYRPKGFRVGRNVRCDKRVMDWVSSLDALMRVKTLSRYSPKYSAFSLLQDDVFRKYFDKPVRSMSSEEYSNLYHQLSKYCVNEFARNRTKQILVSSLGKILINSVDISMSELAIYPYAKQAALNWRTSAIKQINLSTQTGNQHVNEQYQNRAIELLPVLWTQDKNTLHVDVTAANNTVNSRKFIDRVQQLARVKPMTLNDMVELTKYMKKQSIAGKDGQQKGISITSFNEASASIQPVVNKQIVGLARNYAKNISSPRKIISDLSELESGPFRSLATYLSDSRISEINKIFFDEGKRAINRMLKDEKQYFTNEILTISDPLERLHKTNEYESSIEFKYSVFTDDPVMASFNLERRKNREYLLEKNLTLLTNRVSEFTSKSELKEFYGEYLLETDLSSPAGDKFETAYLQKKFSLDPLEGIKGKDYLYAIYSGSYDAVKKKDRLYLASLKSAAKSITKRYSMFGIDNARSSAVISNMTAFNHVFARYLLDYQDRYEDCLTERPYIFTLKRTTQGTVTTNGWGVEVSRTPGTVTYTNYKVPPKFTEMINQLGVVNTKSFSLAFMDNQYSDGRIGEAVGGIQKVMKEFPCDSPFIARLEDSFISLYHRFH